MSLNSTILFLIKSWALPSHTSVPWDNPAILISSANVVGLVSATSPIVKPVPNSGIPRVPVSHIICSLVTPSGFGDKNIPIVSLSSNGTLVISCPLNSWIILSCVGSECPKISSFNRS